jgi:hypothetical protein
MRKAIMFYLVFMAILLSSHGFCIGAQVEKGLFPTNSPEESGAILYSLIQEKEKSEQRFSETPSAKSSPDSPFKIVPRIFSGQYKLDHAAQFRETERSNDSDFLKSLMIFLEFKLKF